MANDYINGDIVGVSTILKRDFTYFGHVEGIELAYDGKVVEYYLIDVVSNPLKPITTWRVLNNDVSFISRDKRVWDLLVESMHCNQDHIQIPVHVDAAIDPWRTQH